eukprot:CAMPEP_0180081414 /NCGR_PEP_ID=MMETSP0985-20121206/18124_1 /TAXON_ID=483367 /ORGANISM="non described non described, Strain CCMP 2436" /LENGTH=77 /DNA_ID=CAMNT_0022014625 /DNA_START=42 /DNA_END=271 /DNA_ORIENTATION=+
MVTPTARASCSRPAPAPFANSDGLTALMRASVSGHAECTRLLIEAGTDVPATDTAGGTAFFWGSGRLAVVQLLCAYG